MTSNLERSKPTGRAEAWRWWESRRLRYNIGLAMAGWIAYAAFGVVLFNFQPEGQTIGLGTILMATLVLGGGYLVVMALANVCYLLGVAAEIVFKPKDLETFRARAWDLGYWGSIALPFLLPLITLVLAVLFAPSRY